MMELLSPAGDREALIAAIRNGADAVYLGGQMLNARRGAGNFDADGLLWAADYCHERGRKLYVTVNTLVKQAELPLLSEIAGQLSRAGADAAIVQDLGAAKALGQMLPGLALHASTQMAVHNRSGVRFLKRAGFERVVLARELNDEEIRDCADEGLSIEVFCHGALCVSCSGQCLFSSIVGSRSGNRGMCAQPCRLPYELAGSSGYLLSPRDLMQLGRLRELERAGVHSLKVEGRLKRPEYVAIVTRIYREVIDHPHTPGADEMDELKQIFNRGGFTRGYGPGLIDSELMDKSRPNHAGLEVGRVVSPGRVKLNRRVRMADGLMLWDKPVKLCGEANEVVRADSGAPVGEALIRLADDEQLRAARLSYESNEPPTVSITGEALIRVGQPMHLSVSDGDVEIHQIGIVVERAQKNTADPVRVRAQLEKTGGTIYRFGELKIELDADAFVPVSALNVLRRDALDALKHLRIQARRGCEQELQPFRMPVVVTAKLPKPRLCVQSSDTVLLESALEWGADEVVFQPADITPESLGKANPKVKFRLALPMVCPEVDLLTLNTYTKAHSEQITGVQIANPAHLALDWPGTPSADFSMNVANDYTVNALNMRYTPSVELTAQEIAALGGDKELFVYGRLPLMQLRHCPLNARRTSVPHAACHRCDSGRTIEEHRLIDRKGIAFPLQRLKTQTGCIARVLNSVPLMLLRHMNRLPEASAWRLLMNGEPLEFAESAVRLHRLALEGQDFKQSAHWAALESMDTTTGHYFRGVE